MNKKEKLCHYKCHQLYTDVGQMMLTNPEIQAKIPPPNPLEQIKLLN